MLTMIQNVICDDKKVGEVMRALAGKVVAPPNVVPIINAELKQGRLTAAHGNSMLSIFAAWLSKHHTTEINAEGMRQFLASQGRSKSSYSYLLQQAQLAGILKKSGKGTHSKYSVHLGQLALPAPKKGK